MFLEPKILILLGIAVVGAIVWVLQGDDNKAGRSGTAIMTLVGLIIAMVALPSPQPETAVSNPTVAQDPPTATAPPVSRVYVVLDENYENNRKSIVYNVGERLGALDDPGYRDGYTFLGWYTEKSGGKAYGANTTVGEDGLTLYAHWEKNAPPAAKKYTISFDSAGGTAVKSMEVEENEAFYPRLTSPSRDYYAFDGWFSPGGVKIAGDTRATSSMTLTAHWSQNGLSGWARASDVPKNAQIVEQKWTYTQVSRTDSSQTSMSGWSQVSSRWDQTGSGSISYAYFPSGFDQGHRFYAAYSSVPSAYENATSKRTLTSPVRVSWIYWHWVHWTTLTPANRYVDDHYTTFFEYFHAYEDTQDLSHTDPQGATDNAVYYANKGFDASLSVGNAGYDGNTSTMSWWWFRLEI